MSLRAIWGAIVISLVLLLSTLAPTMVQVHAQSSGAPCPSASVSCIYISPVSTCCSGNSPIAPNNPITVDVMLNLVAGQAFNGFDVRINYTNPDLYRGSGALRTEGLGYSNNVLVGHNPQTPDAECIDGIGLLAQGQGCASDDYPGPGQIHFAQGILGSQIPGPLSGLLFSLTFNVTGTGASLLYFDRANLVNLNPQPPGSGNFSPIYVPIIEYAGIFGNQGMTALFNYSPADPVYSVSVVRGQSTIFDATGSVQALNASMSLSNFSWNFGDGSPVLNTNNPIAHYTFNSPGNYSVRLTVTDTNGRMGSITRIVPVVSVLGNLLLTVVDQSGTILRAEVNVALFNTSNSLQPFAVRLNDNSGQVTFRNIVPGTYYAKFNGPRVISSSRNVNVNPGVTSQATIYLPLVSQPVDYSWLLFVIPTVGVVGAVGGVAFVKRRNSARLERLNKSGSVRPKKRDRR